MIHLETRLLEILDWDEQRLESLYERSAKFLERQRSGDKGQIERALVEYLKSKVSEEGAKIVFQVLDQNIRRQMRIIEE
jgi:hypothetical protein